MVPGNEGCGLAVLAAMAMLAPSFAARSAIAKPMPRLAPVINRVRPRKLRCSIFNYLSYSIGLVSKYDRVVGSAVTAGSHLKMPWPPYLIVISSCLLQRRDAC